MFIKNNLKINLLQIKYIARAEPHVILAAKVIAKLSGW